MKRHQRGYISNDGRYLIEKEELETECHCSERPYPLDTCSHPNGTVLEDRWFVYDLTKSLPGDPTTLLSGHASGLSDSVFEAASLGEVREWLGEGKS